MSTKTESYISRCCGYDALYDNDHGMFMCLSCGCECAIVDPSDVEPFEVINELTERN